MLCIPQKKSLIQGLQRDVSCKVVHKVLVGIPNNVSNGFKQGCILSSLIFTSRNSDNFSASRRPEPEDISLQMQRESGMNEKLSKLIRYPGHVGLKINVAKIKLMRFCLVIKQSKQTQTLHIDNTEIVVAVK